MRFSRFVILFNYLAIHLVRSIVAVPRTLKLFPVGSDSVTHSDSAGKWPAGAQVKVDRVLAASPPVTGTWKLSSDTVRLQSIHDSMIFCFSEVVPSPRETSGGETTA